MKAKDGKMLHKNNLTLLAYGMRDEAALTALIALHSQEADLAVVLNDNLNSSQIQTLIDRYKGYDDFFSQGSQIAILLASRLDLTQDQTWEIVKSDNQRMRQALTLRRPKPDNTLGYDLLRYIFHTSWFTPKYANISVNLAAIEDDDQRLELTRMYESRVKAESRMHAKLTPRASRENDRINKQIRYAKRSNGYQMRDANAVLNEDMVKVAAAIYVAPTETVAHPLLEELDTMQDKPVVLWLENKIKSEMKEGGPQYWGIFFPLLQEWNRSLADLVITCNSLIEDQNTTT